MTLHMERHSVPTNAVSEFDTSFPLVNELGFIGSRSRVGAEQISSLREHGRQTRAASRADRFERMAIERSSLRGGTALGSLDRKTLGPSREAHRSTATVRDAGFYVSGLGTSARGSLHEADRMAAQTRRSIEHMQTITAAALGVLAGFVLFLILLYTS